MVEDNLYTNQEGSGVDGEMVGRWMMIGRKSRDVWAKIGEFEHIFY